MQPAPSATPLCATPTRRCIRHLNGARALTALILARIFLLANLQHRYTLSGQGRQHGTSATPLCNPNSCDASAPSPTALRALPTSIAHGSSCSTCNTGYTLSGQRSCSAGDLNDTAVCNPNDCTASLDNPNKNGDDGVFYCINEGTVSGTTGSCLCSGCKGGYGGASCETAGACSASADSSKDGSDGTFYCINGGTVRGSAGSCECTCKTGYEGSSCQTAAAATMSPSSPPTPVSSPPPPPPPSPPQNLIKDDDDHASTHQGFFLLLTMTAVNFILRNTIWKNRTTTRHEFSVHGGTLS